jgi:hypothetical protein
MQNRKYIGEYRYHDVVVPKGVSANIYDELFLFAQHGVRKNRQVPSTMKAEIKVHSVNETPLR